MGEARDDGAFAWWSAERRRYNGIVVGTGIISFVFYLALGSMLPDVEVTAFTLAFQFVGAGVYLLLANAAYGLGALIERRLLPRRVSQFRARMFWSGVVLSIAPIIAVPVLLLRKALVV